MKPKSSDARTCPANHHFPPQAIYEVLRFSRHRFTRQSFHRLPGAQERTRLGHLKNDLPRHQPAHGSGSEQPDIESGIGHGRGATFDQNLHLTAFAVSVIEYYVVLFDLLFLEGERKGPAGALGCPDNVFVACEPEAVSLAAADILRGP